MSSTNNISNHLLSSLEQAVSAARDENAPQAAATANTSASVDTTALGILAQLAVVKPDTTELMTLATLATEEPAKRNREEVSSHSIPISPEHKSRNAESQKASQPENAPQSEPMPASQPSSSSSHKRQKIEEPSASPQSIPFVLPEFTYFQKMPLRKQWALHEFFCKKHGMNVANFFISTQNKIEQIFTQKLRGKTTIKGKTLEGMTYRLDATDSGLYLLFSYRDPNNKIIPKATQKPHRFALGTPVMR